MRNRLMRCRSETAAGTSVARWRCAAWRRRSLDRERSRARGELAITQSCSSGPSAPTEVAGTLSSWRHRARRSVRAPLARKP